ncbi:MAG: hypothetical protein KGJ13_05315 [Patescibacteria group bacterium]|nr:hypothetical protein [Patescibacteria group bacterium]
MAMRRLRVAEFESELEARECSKVGTTKSGHCIWETKDGEPFSVSPPEEDSDGHVSYPDWMLDDLIAEVGLPTKKRVTH